ncbi:MAG TPA: hypothetical protein PL182_06560 [Pseudobdellovibrionaceae bacterium]|nr:hypothetical protein [Pseudobdellovibrionaceae bacterium]
MKWNFLRGLQTAAAALSCVTMLMTPLAQGAQANTARKEEFKRFLKMAGFDNPKNALTVGEFHRKFRLWYPEPMRNQLDNWVSRHRHEKMPKVDSSIIKDADGNEQLRLFFTKDGQSFTLTTGEGYAQIGSVKMTAADYYNPQKFVEKLSTKDNYVKNLVKKHKPDKERVSIALTKKEFASFTKKQRAQYLLHLSYLARKAAFVLTPIAEPARKTSSLTNPAFEVIARWVMGEPAFCEVVPKIGDSCIVAGWVSTYGENKSCGGVESGRAQWNQQIKDTFSSAFPKASACSSGFPCNPLVYGFQSNGQSFCVSQTEVKYATKTCNERSPLSGQDDSANARRIVESWLAAQGDQTALEFNEKGELRADQYERIAGQLDALNAFIGQAEAACDSAEGQKLQEKREDQRSACEEIRKRRLALQKFIVAPAEEGGHCTATCPGSTWSGESQACICDDGNPPRTGADGKLTCGDELLGPVEKEKKKTNWWPWIIGGALVAGVASCLLWWCKSKDKVTTPPVTPPVDDCDINPSLPKCQPVDPCIANPTAPTCTPEPPPPPPPPPPSEGGTGTPDPDVSGGVR